MHEWLLSAKPLAKQEKNSVLQQCVKRSPLTSSTRPSAMISGFKHRCLYTATDDVTGNPIDVTARSIDKRMTAVDVTANSID